ncbi:MAG: ABC transporter ATP-binding protein [Proteobacteria bacterium]|nr:MAG: ABC transporter ATP-binding protein [Pseudomonadota bacterium]
MELQDVSRRFGTTEVLNGISLAVREGSFTSLLGPSGCGKSTTLRIMAGLEQPSAGHVRLKGRDVSELTASQRNVAMVFQSYALYPHLTVAQNIALPLAMREMTRIGRAPLVGSLIPGARAKRRAHAVRVAEVADVLGISSLLRRKPSELSGGQKQRAAVGRALVRDPVIFLLDEPLSNLDAKLRVQMRAELTALHKRTGRPFVYVTHDQAEAMSMSDQVIAIMDGRIAQSGTPKELYERPANSEVAAFIGSHPINLIKASLENGKIAAPFQMLKSTDAELPADVLVGLRPEHLLPARGGAVTTRLDRVEYLGSETLLHVRLDDGSELRSVAPGSYEPPPPGDTVTLDFEPKRAHLFNAETGRRLETSSEVSGR